MRLRVGIVASVSFLTVVVTVIGVLHAEWLDGYGHRRPVTLQSTSNDPLASYQVQLPVGSSFNYSAVKNDGSDLRVTLGDGNTEVPYWIEKWDPANMIGCLWVKAPLITVGDNLLYLYYGNSGANSSANGDSTFEMYDGFEDFNVGAPPTTPIVNPGEWTRYAGNPILSPGASGAWDDHGATFASVIYDSLAGEFRMYYHGYSYTGVHQIGLATSPDGMNWTKYAGNPIVTPGPGAWDGQSVRVPMVWKEGLTDYRMIYTGAGSGGLQIGYATSTDGIHWTKSASNPVFNDPTWAHGATENWGVMKVGSQYLMWYSDFGMRQSGIAVSTDLVTWAPYQAGPIFASSGVPSDDRYSQFCSFSFKYEGYYYVLMPSYSSVANYSKNYLYRSSSPYFPTSDRHIVRITRTLGPDGAWDDHDGDTPYILTLDIERTKFFNDQIWCYYSSEEGSDYWREGLMIEPDIAAALADRPLPNPGTTWSVSGDITVVDNPTHSGQRSVRQTDPSATLTTQLSRTFAPMSAGRVGAWMRRTSSPAGDYDIYLYGGSALTCVGGLGRDGEFHYWNGSFHTTGVPWAVDTWYLVTLFFDAGAHTYDFVVTDEQYTELVRVEGISFGNVAPSIDRAMLYTSATYAGDAFVDDFRVAKWCGADIPSSMGTEEEIPTGTQGSTLPSACVLHQNYPNPFNPTTTIRFAIPERSFVTLEIFDLTGSSIARLVAEEREAGEHAVVWNGVNNRGEKVGSGIYLYRLTAGAQTLSRKLVLLR
jgi:hypothetical protein